MPLARIPHATHGVGLLSRVNNGEMATVLLVGLVGLCRKEWKLFRKSVPRIIPPIEVPLFRIIPEATRYSGKVPRLKRRAWCAIGRPNSRWRMSPFLISPAVQFRLNATLSVHDSIDLIFHFQRAVQFPLTATRSRSHFPSDHDSIHLISHLQCNFH